MARILPLPKLMPGNMFYLVFRVVDQRDRVLVDPSTLTVTTKFPTSADETETYGIDDNITRLSEGRYRFEKLLTSEYGEWEFVINTTGSFVGTDSFRILVEA